MKRFLNYFKGPSTWAVFGILAIVFLVAVQNYTPGTWYWGWDNLVPEINPWLSIKRQLAGFWQEYQGVGTIGGHGYMAALPHTLSTLILDLFLPTSAVRYAFTLLMYALGGLGSFFLIKHVLFMLRQRPFTIIPAAFLGAVFYLLSLGTVLTFYVQLEPFIVMYGLLPWALLQLFGLLNEWKKKKLVLFFVTNLGLSVIGFIPPVFITYILFVLAVLIWYLKKDFTSEKLHHVSTLLITLGSAHAYWILPLMYYSISQSDVYLHSKLNQLSTEDFILKNKAYGDIFNVALLKGFFFESLDLQKLISSGEKQSILDAWMKHLSNPFVALIGYSMFGVVITGFISVLRNKTQAIEKSVTAIFLVVLSGLAMNVFPFALVSAILSWIPFLNQAFRSPYNKLSMSASLLFAVMFAAGMAWIFQKIHKHIKDEASLNRVLKNLVGFVTVLIILFSLPSIQGHFLYQGNKVSVPEPYFELFKFFNQQSNQTRVMTFPLQSFNGWVTYDWGYTGSGFLWYGIKQPLMDRAFDVWSSHNETFYNEASRAFYAQDADQFSAVLKKYNISYILIDESVTTWTDSSVLKYLETKDFLQTLGATQVWESEFLHVYEVPNHSKSFVSAPSTVTPITTDIQYGQHDPALAATSSYISRADVDRSYPFVSLNRTPKIKDAAISLENSYITVVQQLDAPAREILLPRLNLGEYYGSLVKLDHNGNSIEINFLPSLKLSSTDETYSSPTFDSVILSVPEEMTETVLLINNQVINLASNTSKTVFLQSLRVGQQITFQVVAKENIAWQDGSLVINQDNIPTFILPASAWDKFLQEKVITTETETVTLQLATEYQELLPLFKDQAGSNCDVFSRGKVEKKNNKDGVVFSANNFGTYCQSVSLDGITTQTPSLISIEGINNRGRGLKISVSKSDQSFGGIEAIATEKKFAEIFPLFDWQSQRRSQYFLTLETKSYGMARSQNTVTSLKVMPLPMSFEYLSSIAVTHTPSRVIENNASITSTTKLSNFFYRTELTEGNGSGILTLSQSHAPGWIAFAPFRPWDKFTSVQYNGWSYAWILPQDVTVVNILYWPQALSFIGFGLIPVYFLWLKDL